MVSDTRPVTAHRVRAADQLLRWPRRLRSTWRGSLILRVTSTTLVLSFVAIGLLGFLLLSRITTGLLDAKERSAVTEATVGLSEAQRLMDAADTGATTPVAGRLVDTVVTALAARAGSPGLFDVLLLSSGPEENAPERGTNLVAESSVPPALREVISQSLSQAWTFSEIQYLDGRSVPGLVVGAPLVIPTVGLYELYFLFPLDVEQQTLELVRGAVVVTGIVLVGLVVVVALLVTRQVVAPVRTAARTASRFSEGHLGERLEVKGEDDLARLAASFNDMATSIAEQITQLEQLSTLQQRFVSDVSHELRTPLTTIRMAADVMFEHRDAFDAPTARAAELLQAQLDRFESLLVDLLEISRFDAGVAVLEAETVEIIDLVTRVAETMHPLAVRAGISMHIRCTAEDTAARVDPRRVDRVLRNLMSNAVEHADGKDVQVTVGADDLAVAVTVRDFGIGLHADQLDQVFERFWRADPARARSTGGTGLGLAIAVEDTRLHGGVLEVWGAPGDGACFRLTLPRLPNADMGASPLPLVDEMTAEDEQYTMHQQHTVGPEVEALASTPTSGQR